MRQRLLIAIALSLTASSCTSNTTAPVKVQDDKRNQVPPCHPGCFPAGTTILTPGGSKRIETIVRGDVVILVDAKGAPTGGTVYSTFQTTNRLIEIRTDVGSILTTVTQPLCLHSGGFRTAGELTAGDQIWRWSEGKRCLARVEANVATERDAAVFNLVVGESAIFVAGGFLARGKPPIE